MMRKTLATPTLVRSLVLPLLVTFLPCAAWAHGHLKTTIPVAESTVQGALKTLQFFFSEAIEADFSTVELLDSDGRRIPVGRPEVAKSDRKVLIVPLERELNTGIYRVRWKVASIDTHRIEGSFTFFVESRAK